MISPANTLHNKLDNPAWFALQENHAAFAMGDDFIKRYLPSVAPFIAYSPGHPETAARLVKWVTQGESFYMIGVKPFLPAEFELVLSLDCVQMISNTLINIATAIEIKTLGDNDADEMFDLINLVQPGYYLQDTRLMGNYAGIRVSGQLVAIAGERMRMNGLTELSAVVTHPEFTGRSYAQQLIAHITNENIKAGNEVFLHAAASNKRAIGLYEHLGFTLRRMIGVHKIVRNLSR